MTLENHVVQKEAVFQMQTVLFRVSAKMHCDSEHVDPLDSQNPQVDRWGNKVVGIEAENEILIRGSIWVSHRVINYSANLPEYRLASKMARNYR